MILCLCNMLQAQRHNIFSENITTLQVTVNNDWLNMPIMTLASNDILNISFDELSHTYHRYSYTITHCDADWKESEGLFTSDYIEGFGNGLLIDDFKESINTNQLYTHYNIQIPNERCSIKMSGNYKLSVIDEETRDTIITACFYVVEPIVATSINILYNTDIDIRKSHHQLDLRVDYPSSLRVSNPRQQFKAIVLQNERIDNAVILPPAPQLMQNGMQWTHCRNLIFQAGNEYHKYEFFDPHRNSLGVESVNWDGEMYHIHLHHDYIRRSYVYDEDANGSFLIRNSDNIENNTTTDYAITHFYLDSPPLLGDVYIEGKWTLNDISQRYKMNYDKESHCYTTSIPLKMGYYSYQYLYIPFGKEEVTISPSEGNFYETENKYNVFIYFRGNIDRTDRLVGTGTKCNR